MNAPPNNSPPRLQFTLSFLFALVTVSAVFAALAQRWPWALAVWLAVGWPILFRMAAERQVLLYRWGRYDRRCLWASMRLSTLIVVAAWSLFVLVACIILIVVVPPIAIYGASLLIEGGQLMAWPLVIAGLPAALAALWFFRRNWPSCARPDQPLLSLFRFLVAPQQLQQEQQAHTDRDHCPGDGDDDQEA